MNTTIDTTIPVSFTKAALEEIKHLYLNTENNKKSGLRIGVEGGGCAGFSYVLVFDNKQEHDNVYIVDGIQIYINKTQEMYLFGTTIDFKLGLDNRGFVYENPNATSTCGCGTSFSA
jgi:iron-sulfur cluster assembly protein